MPDWEDIRLSLRNGIEKRASWNTHGCYIYGYASAWSRALNSCIVPSLCNLELFCVRAQRRSRRLVLSNAEDTNSSFLVRMEGTVCGHDTVL